LIGVDGNIRRRETHMKTVTQSTSTYSNFVTQGQLARN